MKAPHVYQAFDAGELQSFPGIGFPGFSPGFNSYLQACIDHAINHRLHAITCLLNILTEFVQKQIDTSKTALDKAACSNTTCLPREEPPDHVTTPLLLCCYLLLLHMLRESFKLWTLESCACVTLHNYNVFNSSYNNNAD